jgi:hypothetical protein
LDNGEQEIQKERNANAGHVKPEYQNRCYNLFRMTPIPFDLPLRPAEAGRLAELIFEHAEGKRLTEEVRSRLEGRASQCKFESLTPYMGSLEPDPVHPSSYYVAVDAASPLLLHIALSSAPTGSLYPKALLIGRMRTGRGREIVINAVPFAATDRDNVRIYAEKVDRAFLPRPQGPQAAIATGNRHPEISLPAAFEAFRGILKSRSLNLASTVQLSATREMTTEDALAARDGENPGEAGHTRVSIRHLYHAGLWSAIRAGWREGYTAEADHIIVTGHTRDEVARSLEAAKEAIRHAAGYTKFTTDTSRLFALEADTRHPRSWSEEVVEEKFETTFNDKDRRWILGEFDNTFNIGDSIYRFERGEVVRLAVKFGESLKLNETLYDFIRQTKAGNTVRAFDFEPSIDEAETLTTPKEMIFYMHWLKLRGRPAQLVPPNLGFKKRQAYPETCAALVAYAQHKMWPDLAGVEDPLEDLAGRVKELAAIARHFQGTLSIHSGSGKQPAVLELIGKSTLGRVNYKISGELQLQLFDVLAEQPPGSPWRALYDRMVERANAFAAQNAFGAESALAAEYRASRGASLGDPAAGRTGGNLFLMFWLGNVVGSRDVHSPDGDRRFFKEKLDELPAALVREVRSRNVAYITWLADNLLG